MNITLAIYRLQLYIYFYPLVIRILLGIPEKVLPRLEHFSVLLKNREQESILRLIHETGYITKQLTEELFRLTKD